MSFDPPDYVECPECRRVLFDGGLDLLAFKVTSCPSCGARGEPRYIWPQGGLGHLEIAHERWPEGSSDEEPISEEESENRATVACMFLCAASEALLETILWTTLECYGTPLAVALALHKRCRQRLRLLALYKDLAGSSAKEVLQERGHGAWYDAWGAASEARNQIGHGQGARVEPASLDLFRDQMLPAFADLQNFAVEVASEIARLRKTLDGK